MTLYVCRATQNLWIEQLVPIHHFVFPTYSTPLPWVVLCMLTMDSHDFCSHCWPRRATANYTALLSLLPETDSPQAGTRYNNPSPQHQAAPQLCNQAVSLLVLLWLSWNSGWPSRCVELAWDCCSAVAGITSLCPAAPSHHFAPSHHCFEWQVSSQALLSCQACLSRRDQAATVSPWSMKQLLQECQKHFKIMRCIWL